MWALLAEEAYPHPPTRSPNTRLEVFLWWWWWWSSDPSNHLNLPVAIRAFIGLARQPFYCRFSMKAWSPRTKLSAAPRAITTNAPLRSLWLLGMERLGLGLSKSVLLF